MKKYINKKNIFYIIIFVVYVIAISIVASRHEYWADEANAWLLARDATIWELFTKFAHADGHPMLWHLIIKFFQFIKLPYKYFNIVSVIFSSLGVYLLLFKSKFKWYIKALIPFTYFIFYQYSVIARGYCLILPLLCLLAIIWENRKEHYFLFTLLLTLLISLEVYTLLIAGSIYLLEIIDYIKNRKKYNKNILYYLIVLFFIFLITSIYVFPLKTNTFIPIKKIIFSLANSFVSSTISPFINYVNSLLECLIIVTIIVSYLKSGKKKELLELIIIFLPLYLFLSLKIVNLWHLGIPFILFIFIVWIHKLENNKLITLLLLITCLIQISWSYKTSLYDINNKYSSGQDVAEFIKRYDYKELKIYGTTFYESSINPFFTKNILLKAMFAWLF